MSSPTTDERWWHQPFSVFQTNLQEIDALLDVEATLDVIDDYGADTWLLNTGGIVSFYPSELRFQSPNPQLVHRPSGDLVGDAVASAHERGMRVISRLDFSKVSSRVARENPSWLFVDPDGKPQIYNTLYSACPSGEYYQQRTFDVLDEIMERYPVDGFFFNWFNYNERDYSRRYVGVCHCASCHERFAESSGGEKLPAGPESENYWTWLSWSFATTAELTRRIGEHVSSRRPDVGLVMRNNASIAYQEAHNSFGVDVWHHEPGENVSAGVSASPDVPVMENCVSFVDTPYRMAAEQPERFEQYVVQTIARGGNPSTYIMGAPGRIPYGNLTLGREITRFYRSHRELYGALRPGARTAVVRPNRFGMRPPAYRSAIEEYRGVYASLQQAHHPFDVVPVEGLVKMGTEGRLGRYDLIVLPGLGALGPDVAGELDSFAERGGHLITTGQSGMAEDGSVELASGPALMRFGDPISDEALWSTYATVDDQPDVNQYRYAPSVVPVYGDLSQMVWKPGVKRTGCILPPAPYGPPEKCYGHVRSDDPAWATATHGAGSVTMLPWSIGRTYRELGTTEVRDLFLRAVTQLVDPHVSVSLPEQVELIVGTDAEGYVFHLLNFTGVRHRSFGPHVPIAGGQLRLHGTTDGDAASALVSNRQLDIRLEGDDMVLDLPPLELFEVVRVRCSIPSREMNDGQDMA